MLRWRVSHGSKPRAKTPMMRMRIAQLREERGWSQAELAHRTGLRIATISAFENGKGNPKLSTLQDLAAAFNVPVLDLFEDEGADPQIAEIVSRLRQMHADDLAALQTILRTRR